MTTVELVDEDPTALVLGANVRLDARLTKEFMASIKERGVLEPVIAYMGDDDRLVVLHGQRRTLAAVKVKRPTIPVMVVAKPDDSDRLVDQVSENEHREALTAGERLGAYEQLAALGVSAAQIAKRTATDRAQVDAGLTVAKSTAAREAVERHPLTIEQAAVIAEFEGDDEAVQLLVRAAPNGQFEHVAQRHRDRLARLEEDRREAEIDAELIAKTTAELTAAGVTVVDEPDWNSPTVRRLSTLGHDGEALTEETHAGCPGAAVYLEVILDAGASVEDGAEDVLVCSQVAVCVDYTAHGHTKRGQYAVYPQPGTGGTETAEEARAEAAKAERRDVIASNKAWDSAQTVRREWLRKFLGRKSAPKLASLFIAETLALGDYPLRQALSNSHQLAHKLLGTAAWDADIPWQGPDRAAMVTDMLAGVTEARAEMITLGLMLAAQEEGTTRDHWRHRNPATARYLRYLESQGYELSDVEKRAVGDE